MLKNINARNRDADLLSQGSGLAESDRQILKDREIIWRTGEQSTSGQMRKEALLWETQGIKVFNIWIWQ